MSSTVVIATGAAVSMGPVGLGLLAGAAIIAFLASKSGSKDIGSSETMSRAGCIAKEEAELTIREAWRQTQQELKAEASGIISTSEHGKIIEAVNEAEARYKKAITDGDSASAMQIISNIREKMFSIHADEMMLKDKQNRLLAMIADIETKAPAGFRTELEALRKNLPPDNVPVDEKSRSLNALTQRLRKVIYDISAISRISIENLEEDKVFFPPVHEEIHDNPSEAVNAKLLDDICDFGLRIAFFSKDEAEVAKSLILEAKEGAVSTFRLKAIRDQIKTTYGYLRERSVLTSMFQQDCQEFLSVMRKAKGTEELCSKINLLLQEKYISREDYNEIYKATRAVLEKQSEAIIDTIFMSKVETELEEMGYQLFDEEGNPVQITKRQIYTLDTPYEGYMLRVRVGDNHTVATRLVRVVGSDEEKLSVSEYQRQKDIETGRKLCGDLEKFYDSLKSQGISVNDIVRKEPEQEAIDVVVGKKSATHRKKRKFSDRAKPQQLKRHL